MTLKKKTILSLVLFFLIFGGLLTAATFTDLQVSDILTRHSLSAGQYYASDLFGSAFEAIGTCPEFLVGALALELALIYITRFWKKKPLKTILQIIAAVGVCGLYGSWYKELFGYILRHFDPVDGGLPSYVWGVSVFLALFTTVLAVLAVNNFSDESVKKLLKFSIVTACAIIASVITVQLIKNPVGRMRYRAMNVIDDYSGFTRWYVVNGQPDKAWMKATFGTSDAFKSFPSGHTRSAASTFYLTTMLELIGVKSKGKRAACWIFAVVFTGLVAVSRIMVGAHFFSDVLMGGTIGFVFAMLSKEFFLCGSKHIKALFGKAA
ncbi:MAG: phosphatase PAP2 family protein [Clostridia bacterium]|nr:phosphatase PAP2 family protein [Clostridia bacterium]